jgi:hypothetical protein
MKNKPKKSKINKPKFPKNSLVQEPSIVRDMIYGTKYFSDGPVVKSGERIIPKGSAEDIFGLDYAKELELNKERLKWIVTYSSVIVCALLFGIFALYFKCKELEKKIPQGQYLLIDPRN